MNSSLSRERSLWGPVPLRARKCLVQNQMPAVLISAVELHFLQQREDRK